MNWEALGAASEFVGALGVIASLFYLASQVRRNSGALEAATNQAVADSTQGRLLAVAQSPALAGAFEKGSADTAELTPGERIQLDFLARATFRGLQNAFVQHQRGFISDEAWRDYEAVAQTNLSRAHIREWWEVEKLQFDQGFQEHINRLASETTTA